jgi:undecaprenyl-diphosphatase
MHILQAIILGIIEGLTEFLPISSTGHLILAEKVLNFHDVQDVFTVVVQSGAIAAVIWFYRKDLIQKTIGLFKRDIAALAFWKIWVIGTIPAGLIGFALEKASNSITTPFVVAIALIIGGIILLVVDRGKDDKHRIEPNLSRINVKQALLIGIGQCFALIPGVSRSGATIVTGLGIGIDRPTITAFSFYLSIPLLVLAGMLKMVKHGDVLGQISGGATTLIVGLIVAFITALFAVSWLLRYISRHNFQIFAYYRIVLGVFILAVLHWL